MSKKIAEGIGGLVLDVKIGGGAFMKTREDARRARRVAGGDRPSGAGVRTEALLTAMDAPLGRAVGNANEVVESIETLKGRGPADLEELSVLLAARMLLAARRRSDEARRRRGSARAHRRPAPASRSSAQIIAHQGGDPRVIDDYARLPPAPDRDGVAAPRDGVVAGLDAELVGRAAVALGAGRDRVDACIDPGRRHHGAAAAGTPVRAGDRIFEIQHRGRGLEPATVAPDAGRPIADAAPPAAPLVVDSVR